MASSHSKKVIYIFATIVTLLSSFPPAIPIYAQVAGATLTGTVKDSSGAVIPNAQVAITDVATGVTRTVSPGSSGLYTAPNLLPGTYEIHVTATGFSTQVQKGITLTVGAQQVLDFTMQVGQVSQTVEVTTEAPTVELTSSSISAEVNATTVRELPLNARDWTQLATLQVGILAVRTQMASSGTINKGTRGFGDQLSNSGHRPNENNYRVNGISINDYSNASPGSVLGGQLGVDGIQEFSVLTINYSAEYGRGSGGVINAVTKSGTNSFHGNAYWFLRDEGLDARNFFDSEQIPPFHRNQFGGSAGGPIKKDRTFVFGNFEGIRQTKSLSFHSNVPTAAARAGNLCSVPTTGTCVPNTITVDSKVVPYLALYDLPNAGLTPKGNGDTGFVNTAGLQPSTDNYVTFKGDHKISSKDSLAASWFFDRSSQSTPDNLLDSTTKVFSQRQMFSLEETHVFSPTLVNAVRIGYSRVLALVNTPEKALTPAAGDTTLGLFPGFYSPILKVPGLDLMQGGLGSQTRTTPTENSFQFYDDAFVTRGTHSIKTGFAVERIQVDYFSRSRPNGTFSFPSLKGFLLNQPKSLVIQNPTAEKVIAGRQTVFGVYVQDDWRMRSNLTVNIGLRYEPVTLPTEAHNAFGVMLDLYSGGTTVPVPHPWTTNQTLRNFAPRIGFSWDPFHNGKTAVRGGFGIFDVLPLTYLTVNSFTGSFPFAETSSAVKLPIGSFPTGAFALVKFDPTHIKNRWIEQHPHRNYAMNWNLNVQREITSSLTAMIGYVGSRTVHQPFTEDDANMVLPTLTSAGYLWPFPVGSGTLANPSVGTISPLFWDGDAFYDSLQARVTKKMSHGFQVQGSYTWGKCIDTGTGGNTGDPFTNSIVTLIYFVPQGRRGLCDFQVAHNVVVNYIWQVPTPKFASGALSYLAGGWQVGGIFSASTGTPFTPIMGGDPLGQNNTDPFAFPDRLSGPGCANPVNPGKVNDYLKLNCFSPPVAPASFASVCQPAAASVAALIPNTCMNLFGNDGRNGVIGPGLVEFDFSVFKNNYVRRISENFNVQFRAEFFNIFNRANFQSPIANSTLFNQDGTSVGGAGAISTTTTDPRQIQFGLKIIW